jgi:ribosomal protein S18 acetylase RimI-like enzyme
VITVTGGADERWVASQDGAEIGVTRLLRRPDGRCFLLFRVARAQAYPALVEAAMGDSRERVNAEVDESEEDIFLGLGFAVVRREHRYVLPTAVAPVPLPPGYSTVSAADADLPALAGLDAALREDVPGTAGWRNDPAEFARQTFEDPDFDPETYLVAVAPAGGYAGLVRVWLTPTGPRLGLVAVLPEHRRRGLGHALLARVFGVLAGRGLAEVRCEVDVANTASNALMARLGARRVGGNIEVERPS